MNDYIEAKIRFTPASTSEAGITLSIEDAQDILSAQLADIGFESFEKNNDLLVSFIPSKLFSRQKLDDTLSEFPFLDTVILDIEKVTEIEGEDWNSEWEKNYFRPYVLAGNKCVIHSSFHKDYPVCDMDIVIDPKMAFGTGHHSTTQLMVDALFNSNLKGKSLLDVGTGSGILAIIASKLGANPITAVEIDEPAYLNALENSELNRCSNIRFILGIISDVQDGQLFDFVLANINRNVILNDLKSYVSHLKDDGQIFLSGFYDKDVEIILDKAESLGLKMNISAVNNDWAIVGLKKK